MADTKITALTAIGANPIIPSTFPIPMVDLTDTSMAASGTTKKVTVNQILGAGGTATLASATVNGALTAGGNVGFGTTNLTSISGYNTLKINNATNGAIIDLAQADSYKGRIVGSTGGLQLETSGSLPIILASGGVSQYRIGTLGVFDWYDGAGGTRMTLNSTGLGVGGSPLDKFTVVGNSFLRGAAAGVRIGDGGGYGFISAYDQTLSTAKDLVLQTGGGNVGIGVTPSARFHSKAGAVTQGGIIETTGANALLSFADAGTSSYTRVQIGSSGNNLAAFINSVQAMTLDASGNLLVGVTSGSYNRIKKDVTADAGNAIFELVGASNATSSIHYSVSSYNANAANAASKFGRDGVTLRSINAGGTVNASGADYAEYMTKAGDFVLSKGGIAGIDANGKLTNVFADAVSFVVKSTDPSYVGNDKWGNDLEGDELESARQLVDRIAFAGQVPVNVTGAKAGDYIVPIVDGTGIKGIAVSKPTFEQYQLAVGKVIAIDADGRARIIVKVA